MRAPSARLQYIVRLALVCATTLLGCSLPGRPTPLGPAPKGTPSVVTYRFAALQPIGFGSTVAQTVSAKAVVPEYSTDPRAAVNAQATERLSPEQRRLLQANGFVIDPSGVRQIYDIYKQSSSTGMPVFVTTDALLHTYHILYDYVLRQVEYEFLVADLRALLGAMLKASATQEQDAARYPVLREAATKNLAFFAVAMLLLDPEYSPPSNVKDLVTRELALIDAHTGFAESPIFGYKEDYSQYVPRGHYTRNEVFERYFRAMMWLGRMMFRLRPGDGPQYAAIGRHETRQAILIVAGLQAARLGAEASPEGVVALWDRIYEPTVFFVGKSDDLNVYDYALVILKTFGESVDLGALSDDARIDAFIKEAATLRSPRIVSSYVTDQEDPSQVTQAFRFMGQRFVPDSYIFQQLVFNKVGAYQGQGKPFTLVSPGLRGFPRGLDIAAVLGSELALAILTSEGDTAYVDYDRQMTKLRQDYTSIPHEQWTENLYWNWLNTLRPLLTPKGEGYPVFMRNEAWARKDLNTFLGSWAELRHDTILYAKQSYTVKATAMRPTTATPAGYVEPNVDVWARLLQLVRQTRAGLADRKLLSGEFDQRFGAMQDTLSQLLEIAQLELSNGTLSQAQVQFLEGIGGRLENLTTFSEKVKETLTSQADDRMAIVADVHTDVNSSQVLEEGVGDAFRIYVVVPSAQGPLVTMGGVFSHYEFRQPMSARLTDEAWQQMAPKPPLAPWVRGIVMP